MRLQLFTSAIAALVLASSAMASGRDAQCIRGDAPPKIYVADASSKVVENVLCCCATGNGQCCKYVSFCGGYFVPGCFCSGHKAEPVTRRGQP